MSDHDSEGLEAHHTTEQITIDARDVRAGHWDEIHMEAGR